MTTLLKTQGLVSASYPLTGLEQEITLQTFPDNNLASMYPEIRHGVLADMWPYVSEANQSHMGIFFAVNKMDGRGRKINNVQQVRAYYAEMDGLTLKGKQRKMYDLLSSRLPPTHVVESRNGLHAYWKTQYGEPVDNNFYKGVNERLIHAFNGDWSVKDIARVLRLNHTYHLKNPNDPFEIGLIHADDSTLYSASDIMESYAPAPVERPEYYAEPGDYEEITEDTARKIYESMLRGLEGFWPQKGIRHMVLVTACGIGLRCGVSKSRFFRDVEPILGRWELDRDYHAELSKAIEWAYAKQPTTLKGLRTLGVPCPKLNEID